MPYDGSGGFSRLLNWEDDASAGIKVRADRHNTNDDDIAQGLANVICRDGQSQVIANIPMNGKRLTEVGDPVDPQDVVTKKYVDQISGFTTSLTLSGADANGRINFTSPTGANGLTFVGADLSWLARLADASATPPTKNRLVLNDKVDGTGTDVIVCNDDGTMTIRSATMITAVIKALTGNDALYFQGPAAEDRMVIFTGSDTATSGWVRMKGNILFEFALNGQFKAPAQVFAGNSYLNTDGNISGTATCWASWGAADAFNAINARIESRAQAWANDRTANLQFRKVSQGTLTLTDSTQNLIAPVGAVFNGMQGTRANCWMFYYMYLQAYDPVRGWVTFQG